MPIADTAQSLRLIRHNLDRAEAAAARGVYADAFEFAKGALSELIDLTAHFEDRKGNPNV